MSRSYKKILCWKQYNDKYYKRLVHRRSRQYQDLPNGNYYKYLVNPWDICDWKWYEWDKVMNLKEEYRGWIK